MSGFQRFLLFVSLSAFVVILAGADYATAQQTQRDGRQRVGAGGRGRREGGFEVTFNEADRNKDGNVTLKDIRVARPQFSQQIFDRFDADSNGTITRTEMENRPILGGGSKASIAPKRIEFEGKTWAAGLAKEVKVVQYKGKKALHVVGGENTFVFLPNISFKNGVIECDIAGPRFSGLAFRGRKNGRRAEQLYFRPQNSGTEKHENSVQYAVIGHPQGSWRYLRDKFPGKYESGADIKPNEWFHARLEIQGKTLKVFVDKGKEPVLVVDPMLDGESEGTVGLWAYDTYFANFKCTPSAK